MIRSSRSVLVATTLALSLVTQVAPAAESSRVLAIVDGQNITEADVRAFGAGEFNANERHRLEGIRHLLNFGLEKIINSRLVDAEAAARGVDRAVILAEMTTPPVTDAVIASYYQKYKDVYGVSLEKASPRIRFQLEERTRSRAEERFMQALRKKHAVEVLLEPVRVGFTPHPKDPPVTIVAFSRFRCELCSQLNGTLEDVQERYGEKVQIVFRHFPEIADPTSWKTAEASLCASDQGKFWELHDLLFANPASLDDLKQAAASLKINVKKFNRCLDSGETAVDVGKELADAASLGVTRAPSIFINGRFVDLEQDAPSAEITAVIDDELRRHAAGARKPNKGSGSVLALVAGKAVTEEEVRAANAGTFKVIERQAERATQKELESSLDRLINNRLVDGEAAARGVPRAVLLSELKPSLVGDADVAAFYEANKERIPKTKEEVAGNIRTYLEQSASRSAMQTYVDELRGRHKVEVKLEPLREVVAATGPSIGPANAPVTIIEFSDFQCPFCKTNVPVLDAAKARYGDKVRIVIRHYPLDNHPNAPKAAEASLCAAEQGKFWELRDAMFRDQYALGVSDLKQSATALGLDAAAFASCLDSGRTAPIVARDKEDASAAGVNATPSMFINGRFVDGAMSLERLTEMIDDELRRQGK